MSKGPRHLSLAGGRQAKWFELRAVYLSAIDRKTGADGQLGNGDCWRENKLLVDDSVLGCNLLVWFGFGPAPGWSKP